jgi:hypothetical protein
MKKAYSFLIVLSLPIALLLFSYVSGSPGGKTGSPGDNGSTCTDCHAGTAQSQLSWISSTIPVEGYTAGETYQITATGTHAGVVKFGFELTSEDMMGAKTGVFTITDANRTKLANGGKSVTHKNTGVTPTGNSNSWTVDWTAPQSGSVTFYAAFNAANGNGNTSGDIIYTSSMMVSQLVLNPQITGIDPDHAPLDFSGNLTIMGEDTQWTDGVGEILFVKHDDPAMLFSASEIVIESNTLLTVSIMIPTSLTIGVYDVYVDDLVLENGFIVDQLDNIVLNELSESILLYPNPAIDYLNVNAPVGAEIMLVDMQGKQLKTITSVAEKSQFDVMTLNSGLYFITVRHEGQQSTRKWLKK